MLRTLGSELTSLINSDPAWKVSKGRRSASRRARKTVGKGLKNCSGVICRSAAGSDMPVSESEKHGVSLLGCRFSEKAEHVPIKKRRFLLRTPAPPSPPPSPPRPAISSPPEEKIADHIESQDALSKLAANEMVSFDINSSQITDKSISNDANKSEVANKKFSEDEGFCGISILAAAACSSSLGRDCAYEEDRTCFEEFTMQRQPVEICSKTEERSSSRGLLKEDLATSWDMSIGGTSSCVSTELVGEFPSFSTPVNSSHVVETVKDRKGASSEFGSLTLSSDVSCSRDEEALGNQRHSSRDDRSHWDLNVMMDAWEHPFEDVGTHVEVSHKKSQDSENINHDDNRTSFEGHNLQDNLATTCAELNHMLPGDLRMLTNQILEGSKENQIVVPSLNVSQPPTLLSNCSNQDFMKRMAENAKYMHHHESVNKTDEVGRTADHASQPSPSVNDDEDASTMSVKLSGDGDNKGRSMVEGLSFLTDVTSCGFENVGAPSASDTPGVDASADNVIGFCVSSDQDNIVEVATNSNVLKKLESSHEVQDDGNGVKDKVDLEASKRLGHAFGMSKEEDLFHSSSCAEAPKSLSTKCKVSVTLDTSLVQQVGDFHGEKPVCNNESTSNPSEIHPVINKETCDFVSHDTCKIDVDKSLFLSDKMDAAESHGRCDADSKCHPVSVVGPNAVHELQEGYDSQYEDGELREMNECGLGKCFVDREAEHVHCRKDIMQICVTNPTHYHLPESEQVEDNRDVALGNLSIISTGFCGNENEVTAKAGQDFGDGVTRDDDNKINWSHSASEKMNAARSKDLTESSKSSSDMAARVKGENGANDAMSCHGDGLVDSADTETRTESRACRRVLRSQIEGPVGRDVSFREERLNKMESRYEESSSFRSFERVRYPYHSQGRGRQGDNWNGSFDGRRGFKRHYSPIHGHSKLDDDGLIERDDIRSVNTQDGVQYSHHGLPKNQSSMDDDAYIGVNSRCRPDKKFSPDRAATFGRGRSFRYGPSFDNRIGRGRYTGPSPDESFQSSLKYRRPLSRRERSFSPFGGRGHPNAHHSRGRSPSRSRSRSPVMWQTQRGKLGAGSSGGSTFLRPRDRSPNFRPEVRVQRLRSPHHQPGFGSDHTMGFRSFPRNHNSPPHRWTSGRKDDVSQFREFDCKQRTSALERSPGRIRMRNDRAGVLDSPRNINPDGYYRFSDRISEDSAGRGLKYEENYEDRRKHYGPLRPTRRSYEDGMGSRLHADIDDSVSTNSIRDRDTSSFQGRGLRGVDRRIGDLPRRLRGEQHSFIYERDGKFNSNSKPFGANVMDSSSNLPTEELYQSTHVGRFSEMDGLSRGRRYENYEDRRKQFGVVSRHSGMEVTEKRLNHNVDENFEDAPDFNSRGMRNFDGRIGTVSTRLGENQNPVACGQGENLADNHSQ